MPIDLALSENNDLIIAANHDFAPVFGRALIEQRIRLRLKMVRGAWIYDIERRLGSELRGVLKGDFEKARSSVSAIVHQALRDMTDISILSIEALLNDNGQSILVRVGYEVIPDRTVIAGAQNQSQFATEVLVNEFPAGVNIV